MSIHSLCDGLHCDICSHQSVSVKSMLIYVNVDDNVFLQQAGVGVSVRTDS